MMRFKQLNYQEIWGIDIKVADWFTTNDTEPTTAREIDQKHTEGSSNQHITLL